MWEIDFRSMEASREMRRDLLIVPICDLSSMDGCDGMGRGDTHRKAGPKSFRGVLWWDLESLDCLLLLLSHELLVTWAGGL